MPGVYREKTCPSCGKLHRKRGNYCGQSCANGTRVQTEETKRKISEANAEAAMSPDRVAAAKMLKAGTLMAADEYAVSIPDITDLSDYDLDHYDRASDW